MNTITATDLTITITRAALNNLIESCSELKVALSNRSPSSQIVCERAQRAIEAVERECE